MLTAAKEAVLGGFGWHYDEIVADFGHDPIIQYHKVRCPVARSSSRTCLIRELRFSSHWNASGTYPSP